MVGLSDLARLSGTNKATCFRLMTELLEHGLVEQVPASREYRIGPAVLRLAALREATLPTREAALPLVQALAQAAGETAHFSWLVAGQLVTMGFAYSHSHGVQVLMDDADVLPFHATASGYAVLSRMPPAALAALRAQALPAAPGLTPVDGPALSARVAEAQTRGYARTANTFEADVSSLAVPLFDADGAVTGALALAAPSARMTAAAAARLPGLLAAAARGVMELWGGALPPDLAAQWRGLEQQAEVQE